MAARDAVLYVQLKILLSGVRTRKEICMRMLGHQIYCLRATVVYGAFALLLAAGLAMNGTAAAHAQAFDSTAVNDEAPLDLRVDIYSRSAIELFWNRIDIPGVRYEVRESDTLLATTDGTSYFIEGLSGRSGYTYEVFSSGIPCQKKRRNTRFLSTMCISSR